MATPTLTPPIHIKSAARKLPIKRKTPPQSQSQSHPNPNPNPNPNLLSTEPYHDSGVTIPNGAYEHEEEEDYDDELEEEEEEEEEEGEDYEGGREIVVSGGDLKPPPFKFHRIWSEPDEIRFLQGLLGCWSQGLVFPRDLNLFYDRFSESMPQPYTRSQLSEKLRRLRKKFRIMSARIARGQDPNRLAPHDRDLLYLCTRLWHPSYASSSPFSAPDAAAAGTVGNKRRRPNPRAPTATRSRVAPVVGGGMVEGSPPPLALPAPPARTTTTPPAADGRNLDFDLEGEEVVEEKSKPLAAAPATVVAGRDSMGKGERIRNVAAKTVLDVFDGSLKELRMSLMLHPDHTSSGGDLLKRWQEQRVAELDVFACRLRLVLEQALHN